LYTMEPLHWTVRFWRYPSLQVYSGIETDRFVWLTSRPTLIVFVSLYNFCGMPIRAIFRWSRMCPCLSNGTLVHRPFTVRPSSRCFHTMCSITLLKCCCGRAVAFKLSLTSGWNVSCVVSFFTYSWIWCTGNTPWSFPSRFLLNVQVKQRIRVPVHTHLVFRILFEKETRYQLDVTTLADIMVSIVSRTIPFFLPKSMSFQSTFLFYWFDTLSSCFPITSRWVPNMVYMDRAIVLTFLMTFSSRRRCRFEYEWSLVSSPELKGDVHVRYWNEYIAHFTMLYWLSRLDLVPLHLPSFVSQECLLYQTGDGWHCVDSVGLFFPIDFHIAMDATIPSIVWVSFWFNRMGNCPRSADPCGSVFPCVVLKSSLYVPIVF
jgi:hypothetical protein